MFERVQSGPRRRRNAASRPLLGLFAALGLLAACLAGSGAAAAKGTAAPTFAQACGTAPITLQGYFESGFPDITDLTTAFTKQYPTAKWNVREDPFATITQDAPLTLGGPNPPDLMRLPTIGGLVKDHVLKNLDPYYKAYNWSTFPASQLAQLRTSTAGVGVGSGPLFAMGINYSLTGVFYNKALAAKIGMKSAPKTLAELDALLAKAKAAGITPIEQFDGGATGGLLFPCSSSWRTTAPPRRSTAGSSTSRMPPSTRLRTSRRPSTCKVDQERVLQLGCQCRAVPGDDEQLRGGQGLLIFDGDWESGNFDTHMPKKVGFFLMPPLKPGGKQAAMSAPLTYGIAAKAPHADCAAFFLNWVATSPVARKINVSAGGSNPGGPASLRSRS